LRPRQVAIATQTIAGSTGCQPARGQGSSGPQAGRAACLCAILKSLQSLHRFQGLEYHAKIAFVTLLRLAADVRTASGTQREIPGYEVRDLRLSVRFSWFRFLLKHSEAFPALLCRPFLFPQTHFPVGAENIFRDSKLKNISCGNFHATRYSSLLPPTILVLTNSSAARCVSISVSKTPLSYTKS
jgi:hypothetical protein